MLARKRQLTPIGSTSTAALGTLSESRPTRIQVATAAAAYSTLTAEDFAIGVQRAISASTNAVNAAALIFSASMPS
jgi:hypothetical protein